MTTILIKKKDTAGAPAAGDLTNAAGGAEIAVNTATKRIYTKDAGGNVVELGTNPSGQTINGNVLFSPDNTYDIGASGANRARTLYLGTSIVSPTGTFVNDSSISGLTVGKGTGAVIDNTVVGSSALAANTVGYRTSAFGYQALAVNTIGNENSGFGWRALYSNVAASNNTAVGSGALYQNGANTSAGAFVVGISYTITFVGTTNFVAIGAASNTVGVVFTATGAGSGSGTAAPSANNNTAVGYQAGYTNTAGNNNTAHGYQALTSSTTANDNTAVGYQAAYLISIGAQNTVVGSEALRSNTSGSNNTAVGYKALTSNTTGDNVNAFGQSAAHNNTTGEITAIGSSSLYSNTTGNYNTAVGTASLLANTTGANNTAIGRDSLSSNTTASNNTAVGFQAGYSGTTAANNTVMGFQAGYGLTTGARNTFVGAYNGSNGSGRQVTTGSANTIIGGYDGNQGGLDIRTASNYIVLSDGDGNPRGVFDTSGNLGIGTSSPVSKLQSVSAVSALTSNAGFSSLPVTVSDSTALAADTGGGINFNAIITAGGVYNSIAAIKAGRSIATGFDYRGYLSFYTGSNATGHPVENMRLDSSGNLGLGVTPSAWSTFSTFQVSRGSLAANSSEVDLSHNAYFDGSNWRYIGNGFATNQYQVNGGYAWRTAPSGTAGNAITFTQAMTLDSSGNLGIGTTSPPNKLTVSNAGANGFEFDPASSLMQTYNRSGGAYTTMNLLALSILFKTGASPATTMTLDSSGNLGLGVTPSAWTFATAAQVGYGAALSSRAAGSTASDMTHSAYWNGTNWVYQNSSVGAARYQMTGSNSGSTHAWFVSAGGTAGNAITFTQAMTLDASGNLGVGITNPTAKLEVYGGASGTVTNIQVGNAATGFVFGIDSGNSCQIRTAQSVPILFYTVSTERARITSGGYFKASNAGTYGNDTGSYHELRSSATDGFIANFANTAASPYGIYLDFPSASPDNNTNYFLRCLDSTTTRCYIWSDGDLANHDGVYGTISDARLKQDIVDAGSQWDDLKAIRFRKYRMKTDVEANPNASAMFGVVAQELAEVCPGLVDEHPNMKMVEVTDEEGNVTQTQAPDGTTTMTVKSSILLMKAAKALQEAMARIETLEAKVAQLEGTQP